MRPNWLALAKRIEGLELRTPAGGDNLIFVQPGMAGLQAALRYVRRNRRPIDYSRLSPQMLKFVADVKAAKEKLAIEYSAQPLLPSE
jgi:hypothetical protein